MSKPMFWCVPECENKWYEFIFHLHKNKKNRNRIEIEILKIENKEMDAT